MTRHDYLLLAAALKRARERFLGEEERRGICAAAEEIADELARQSRQFDRALFLRNAGAAE